MPAFVPPLGASATHSVTSAPATSIRSSISSLSFSTRSLSLSATPLTAPEQLGVPHSSDDGPSAPGARGSRVLLLMDYSLRIADNPALIGAMDAVGGPGTALIPLVGLRKAPIGAIAELSAMLAQRGSGLIRVGDDVVTGAINTCARLRLNNIYVNRATSRDAVRMQRRLREAANEAGVQVVEFGPYGLLEEGRTAGDDLGYPEFVKSIGNITPAPIDIPERIPGWLKDAERIGVSGETKIGEGTSAAMKILAGLSKTKELRKTKSAPEMCVLLRPFLNCGAVSESMVAKVIVDVIGKLQGATFEELVWRSYVGVKYQRLENIPAGKTVVVA